MSKKTRWKEHVLNFMGRNFTSHVLLYHSCFIEVPSDLDTNVHNVTPENLYRQLSWYKRHYNIVSLQEWFEAKNRRGLVAVTFDDAYTSVFENGLKVLETLNVPATVFVIGSTLDGKIFWRDKIRFLETHSLDNSFVQHLKDQGILSKETEVENLYRASKSKELLSQVSIARINHEIDDFLIAKNLMEKLNNYCIDANSIILNHPLLRYGSHTYNHYILSTLESDEQKRDLETSQKRISEITGSDYIHKLSIPFGGSEAFNKDTIQICKDLENDGILLSSNSLNGIFGLEEMDGIPLAERFIVPDGFELMLDKIKTMTYSRFKKNKP